MGRTNTEIQGGRRLSPRSPLRHCSAHGEVLEMPVGTREHSPMLRKSLLLSIAALILVLLV